MTGGFVNLGFTNLEKEKKVPRAKKIDYSMQTRNSKKIGNRGEQIVIQAERLRLINEGRKDLANKVKHIAQTNDRAGYDIL